MEHSKVAIQGFSRVQIMEDGKVVGDSGFVGPNQITDLGVARFLVALLGNTTGSSQVGFVALGTGGAPASDAVTLAGEIMDSAQRKAVAVADISSTTAQFTATFASNDSFLSTTAALSNIGLYAATTTNATLFAGNTYTSSSCGTNQSVNVTYQIRFSRPE
jgi:hypothetical protein